MLFASARASLGQLAVPTDLNQPEQPNILTPQEAQTLSAPQTPMTPDGTSIPEVRQGTAVSDIPRRLHWTFGATMRGVYDDNINISSFDRIADFYFAIDPTVNFTLGGTDAATSLSFTYTPQFFIFIDNTDAAAIQHIVRLNASHSFGHLGLGVTQDVQILDGQNLNSLSDPSGHQANIDVGRRAAHQVYTTGVSGSYDLTGKLFLTAAGGLAIDNYNDNGISSNSVSGNLFLNYTYSDKLVVGLGGTGGYNTTDTSNTNQTYEQVNARLSYSVTGKISLSLSGGVEFRQSEGTSGTDVIPVYELSASYHPFDGTSIGLSGSRRTQNSAVLSGQDYAETIIGLSLSQRFFTRFTFGLAFGYTNTDYFSVVEGLNASREDNYFYVSPSVDADVTRYLSVGVYYLYREDSSNFPLFSFYNNQVGFRMKLTF